METSLRERSLPQTGRLRSTVWSTRKHIREKQLLRNKRSSRGEQDRKKKQEIIWLKKKSCKMTDFSLLPVIPPEVHRMVSAGRKWAETLG